MSDDQQPATGGFIQFGDGPRIPIADGCSFTLFEQPEPLEGSFIGPLSLGEISVTTKISTQTTARILRAVGEEAMGDRIEVEDHPDLIELNAQLEGGV